MDINEHIDALRHHGRLLADAAGRAGLDAAIPPCPAWQVKDLLRHTGYIHRWAARHITECPDAVLDGPAEEDILRGGAADPDLLDWFRAGHAALVETLSTADPGLVCATFMDAPSSLAFWARRQAHETAIHRADADSASGIRPEYDPEFAADGIDELITGFGQYAGPGHRHRPRVVRRRRRWPPPGPPGTRRHRPGRLHRGRSRVRRLPVPVEPRRRRSDRRHDHRRHRLPRPVAVKRPRPLGLTNCPAAAARLWATLDGPWQEAFRQACEALRTGTSPLATG
jgi:uncharacterized protein (TIGR03083 family)